jgi:hypothetical protein
MCLAESKNRSRLSLQGSYSTLCSSGLSIRPNLPMINISDNLVWFPGFFTGRQKFAVGFVKRIDRFGIARRPRPHLPGLPRSGIAIVQESALYDNKLINKFDLL